MEKFNPSELANLVMILKIFENQPHNLAQFLVENQALTTSFRRKLKDSQALSKMSKQGFDFEDLYFSNIEEMKIYYESLLDHEDNNLEELVQEIQEKLKTALFYEDYEAAIRYRDHLKKIKRKKS